MNPIQKARQNIEADILAYAKSQARDGETPESALVRLIDSQDPRIESMHKAASIMKQIAEPDRSREQAESVMQQMSKAESARTGASQHEAAASLLRDNADYRKAYSIYVGLQ